jgi:UDP-glucose 4-epimerase
VFRETRRALDEDMTLSHHLQLRGSESLKRVVITGATGFVGANLTRRLLQQGHEIHLLVRTGCNLWRVEELGDMIQFHYLSLMDGLELDRCIAGIRPDWIFHLAAHGAYSWQTDVHQMVQTNIVGTINLVQACLKSGFEAFVNTGSSSEYGFKDHAPSEQEWLEPNSHYAVTKAAATQYCRHIARSSQANILTLRLYSVFGPYEDPHRFMPTLIRHGLRGKLPPLANPDTARDYIYVDDVSQAYILAVTLRNLEQGGVFNIGSGTQTRLDQVVKMARRELDIEAEPQWGSMSSRNWDTGVWVSDNRKAQTEMGWHPQYSLEQGFRIMVEWARNSPNFLASDGVE